MGNQADTAGLNAGPIAADSPAPQNGVSIDPTSAMVVDGAVAVASVEKAAPPHIAKAIRSPDFVLNRGLTCVSFRPTSTSFS
jgi:hypothetical protein